MDETNMHDYLGNGKFFTIMKLEVGHAGLITGLVYLAVFLNFFLVGTIVPIIPRLADDRGLSSSQASVVLSSKSFAHMAASPVLVLLSSRISPELLFCFGQIGIVAAYAGCAFSTSFSGFVISRVSQGIGVASVMVAGMSLLVKVVPPSVEIPNPPGDDVTATFIKLVTPISLLFIFIYFF
jgi:predicted MFS family arabinose efflux permease